MGGSSLTAGRVAGGIRDVFGISLTGADVFSRRTLEDMSHLIDEVNGTEQSRLHSFDTTTIHITRLKQQVRYTPFTTDEKQSAYQFPSRNHRKLSLNSSVSLSTTNEKHVFPLGQTFKS